MRKSVLSTFPLIKSPHDIVYLQQHRFQQKSIEHLYDVIPEMRKEQEKIEAIPQSALEAKIKEMEDSNKKL